jgi:hypothetical protein
MKGAPLLAHGHQLRGFEHDEAEIDADGHRRIGEGRLSAYPPVTDPLG